MKRIRILAVTSLVSALSLVAGGLPIASAQTPQGESVPSFAESPGCGALDGYRGPLAPSPGGLPMSQRVYGPWGDFFGRTIGSIHSQLEEVHLPGLAKDLYIHERIVPAFQQVLDNLAEEAGNGNTYTIRNDTWSWNPATVPPNRHLSFHAAGTAIDVNSATNPYRDDNVLITDMPEWFIDAWRDAGWCWGGDWITIKDPMHYSWMGPLYSQGYDLSDLPKQPRLVSESGYESSLNLPEISFLVYFDSGDTEDAPHIAVDIDRDGAADIVRVVEDGGMTRLETSPARNSFHWSEVSAETVVAPTDPSAPAHLADMTHDGRPDLVFLLEQPDNELDLEVFALNHSGELTPETIETAVPAESGDVYLFDDFDLDGYADLYVIRPGSPGTLELWLGPVFDTMELSVSADFPASSRYALGDRTHNWVPDLFILSETGGLRVRPGVWEGSEAYQAEGTAAANFVPLGQERLFVEDLDGDGHPDMLLVGAEGDFRMRRGGYSSHDPWVWYALRSHRLERLAGANRYETAVAISQAAFESADTVFVATGESFPDALAGAAAAAQVGAPLLLVSSTSIPPVVADELTRLDPDDIVILGGHAAVSGGVQTQLDAYADTTRLSGSSRYETAVAVSQYAFEENGSADTVIVATGTSYADAVAGAAAAGVLAAPVLLTSPTSLPGVVATEILRLGPSQIVVLGGTAAVSSAVFGQLQGLAPSTVRISGANRYETAVNLSEFAFPGSGDAPEVFVATGLNFPDALAGAALAASRGGPILLVPGTSVPTVVRSEITRFDTFDATLFGGTGVLTTGVYQTIETLGL